jgi:hypothetical protein
LAVEDQLYIEQFERSSAVKMAEETVNVNPDGSTTFESDAGEESTMPPVEDAGADGAFDEEAVAEMDPMLYLVVVAAVLALLFYIYKRRSREDDDDFFANLDGEKVRRSLPSTPAAT